MSDTLSGFLLWGDASLRSSIARCRRLKTELDVSDGWQVFRYEVDERIPNVDTDGAPPFSHQLYIRAGSDRLILLSNDYRICQNFIDRDLRQSFGTILRRADTAVHELVVAMAHARRSSSGMAEQDSATEPPSGPLLKPEWDEFAISHTLGFAAARTDAFGGSLERLEFSGSDLVANTLFVDAIPVVRFRSCGIRRKTFDDRGFPTSYEILRIGRLGYLSFVAPTSTDERRKRFKDVEALLRALNRFGFIK